MNLMENAAKYSNRPAQIQVTIDENPNEIVIEVSDKGIGIPQADQEHIFDRFYTVDKAHSQKMGGSGLGFPSSKQSSKSTSEPLPSTQSFAKGRLSPFDFPK